MSKTVDNFNLFIDKEYKPVKSIAEPEEMKAMLQKFVSSYLVNKDAMSLEDWLFSEIAESLPDYKAEEISQMSNEILSTIKHQEEIKHSLDEAVALGRSKESWLAGNLKASTSQMSAQNASRYLQGLDNELLSVNESLRRTITTKSGAVSQNPNLDGYIAEQYHAQTFNMNAKANGSQYRAKVLEPDGNGYGKNSVDIEIVDGNGKVVRRYQAKYCKDAEATAKAYENGDYRGQQKLVPKEQNSDITKESTTVLEAPDGTTSKPLSKSDAKKLQNEAQSGEWNELNWNEYQVKDLAKGIGKQAGKTALMGAAIGAGFYVADKALNGEEIDGAEIIETALTSGADFGIKAASAGALKVGVEKGIITAIPKGTPASTLANIAYVAIEDVKVVGKMASGELTFKEGVDKIEQVTVSTIAGLASSAQSASIGATIGTVFGPVGAAVGGFVGGAVGFMAGSKVGESTVKVCQKIRNRVTEMTKSIAESFEGVMNTINIINPVTILDK